MKAPAPRERAIHAAVAEFLGWALPDGCYFTSIPGGDRSVTLTPGYQPGAPDLILIWRGRPLGIELKTRRGVQSAEQKAACLAWTLAGGLYYVARSVDEVEAILRAIGVPLKGRVAA